MDNATAIAEYLALKKKAGFLTFALILLGAAGGVGLFIMGKPDQPVANGKPADIRSAPDGMPLLTAFEPKKQADLGYTFIRPQPIRRASMQNALNGVSRTLGTNPLAELSIERKWDDHSSALPTLFTKDPNEEILVAIEEDTSASSSSLGDEGIVVSGVDQLEGMTSGVPFKYHSEWKSSLARMRNGERGFIKWRSARTSDSKNDALEEAAAEYRFALNILESIKTQLGETDSNAAIASAFQYANKRFYDANKNMTARRKK